MNGEKSNFCHFSELKCSVQGYYLLKRHSGGGVILSTAIFKKLSGILKVVNKGSFIIFSSFCSKEFGKEELRINVNNVQFTSM